jgi:hypothetical protein
MRLSRALRVLWSGRWLVPLLCVAAGIALPLATLAVDRRFDNRLIPSGLTGGPSAVESALSTFATSMVSMTTLVLTVALVVVQLAMGQFSPRIVRSPLEDRPSQLAIGLFAATFIHAILTLRQVDDQRGSVPGGGGRRRPGRPGHRRLRGGQRDPASSRPAGRAGGGADPPRRPRLRLPQAGRHRRAVDRPAVHDRPTTTVQPSTTCTTACASWPAGRRRGGRLPLPRRPGGAG